MVLTHWKQAAAAFLHTSPIYKEAALYPALEKHWTQKGFLLLWGFHKEILRLDPALWWGALRKNHSIGMRQKPEAIFSHLGTTCSSWVRVLWSAWEPFSSPLSWDIKGSLTCRWCKSLIGISSSFFLKEKEESSSLATALKKETGKQMWFE